MTIEVTETTPPKTDFDKLPHALQVAIAYRAELELFGWHGNEHMQIAFGARLTNIPLESGHVAPPNSTLITLHLRPTPERPDEEFVIVGGYLDNDAWPAEASVIAAMEAWNRLSQEDREAVRCRVITEDQAAQLGGTLLLRGFIPPNLPEELAKQIPKGGN